MILTFSIMCILLTAAAGTFFFLIGKKQLSTQAADAISAICEQSSILETQIANLSAHVQILCDEVNMLKIENQTLQAQIAALSEDVKHISNKCVVITN